MKHRISLAAALLPAVFLTVLETSSAQSFRVTGQVVNSLGVGVSGVDLDFEGRSVPGSTSGIGGFFDVQVPEDRYDIAFIPPSALLAPRMLERVEIRGRTEMGQIVMLPGFPLSATVLSRARNPIPSIDIDVYDDSGALVFTPGDYTDLAGNFQVILAAGTYRVDFRPPATSIFVSHRFEEVVVPATSSLGTVILAPGFPVTARVIHAQSRLPLPNVDLDVENALTGQPVFTPNDNTNGSGAVSLFLPLGLYHVSFSPPVGLPWVGQRRFNVLVARARNLGDIALEPGLVLSGTVLDPLSRPVVGADVDVDTLAGNKLYTPHDSTNNLGAFSVVVPAGDYQLKLQPKSQGGLVGAATPVTVTSNTVIPTLGLVQGDVLSGTLTAFNGSPEIGADIDVVDPFTGTEVVLSNDQSDASGHFSVVVPPGTWDVRFNTRKLSGSRDETLSGVAVAGPSTLDHSLSLVPIVAYLDTVGTPNILPGQPLFVDVALMNLTFDSLASQASVVLTDPDGGETFLIPPSFLVFPPFFPVGAAGLPVFLPPVNPSHRGQLFRLEIRVQDTLGNEFDSDDVTFIIH